MFDDYKKQIDAFYEHVLEIPYYVMNFKQEFQTNVIDYFVWASPSV